MKSQTYMDRALRSSDPRYARVLTKLGYARPKTPRGDKSRSAPKLPLENDGGDQETTKREPDTAAETKPEASADTASDRVKETEQSSET